MQCFLRVSAVLLVSAAAVLAAACGDRDARTHQSLDLPPAPIGVPPAVPPPNPNEQLRHALDALGAHAKDGGWRVTLSSAQFEPGQTGFAPSDAARFDRIVSLLKAHPKTQVRIEGYTDSRGSKLVNERLSRERASAVRQALIDLGIEGWRLTAYGNGEANPIADNSTSEGREQNRRVELIISNARGEFASLMSAPMG